jgi:hypothetical protein
LPLHGTIRQDRLNAIYQQIILIIWNINPSSFLWWHFRPELLLYLRLLSYLLNDSDELRYLGGVNSKIGARVREVSWNLEVNKSSRFKFMVHNPNPDFCESGCM